MKKNVIILLLLAPMLVLGQVKGKKSKKSFKTTKGTEFKVGDMIKLDKASNEDKYAYVYINKSMFSLKNITKAAKTLKNAKKMDVKNVNNLTKNLEVVTDLANNEIVSGTLSKLMGQAVSESYVKENAIASSLSGTKYKIKSFKIYTDKDTGQSIVHAIAKGNGKTVAVLLDFAEKSGELSL